MNRFLVLVKEPASIFGTEPARLVERSSHPTRLPMQTEARRLWSANKGLSVFTAELLEEIGPAVEPRVVQLYMSDESPRSTVQVVGPGGLGVGLGGLSAGLGSVEPGVICACFRCSKCR